MTLTADDSDLCRGRQASRLYRGGQPCYAVTNYDDIRVIQVVLPIHHQIHYHAPAPTGGQVMLTRFVLASKVKVHCLPLMVVVPVHPASRVPLTSQSGDA